MTHPLYVIGRFDLTWCLTDISTPSINISFPKATCNCRDTNPNFEILKNKIKISPNFKDVICNLI